MCVNMAAIVLRVRLISGDNLDLTYEEPDAGSEDEVIDHVVATLAEDPGVLRLSLIHISEPTRPY